MNNFQTDLIDIDRTLIGTTTSGQSGPGSEGVLHTFQIFRTGASPSDAV